MAKYAKGNIVKGTVTGVETYGAFISLDEYYSGLVHISEISHDFVKSTNDFIKIGDTIYVEIIDVDEDNSHLSLSIKNINYKKRPNPKRRTIIETSQGFKSLAYKLPIWIDESLKKLEKTSK